ncbi:FAD/NAD-binding domain-containing protein [Fomitiporia mediterranea MF3/22]|uniref:FAD/NAD-binding domain-containing protein n=1 Tax=Fomitiporia mediterranea (strain MF3/22) TaxID=694068 RepID=UPI0004409A4E|nr:FAD/NAD-binding domain-containing protein [Fomitiporia mediterranea MF3/22]EJD00808.1 FAD/NAD-binding domain-containing protein [Fomitiporia mediterranea MF3/22]
MDSDTHFDVAILGTGLTESLTAAALAKAGLKVAHVDSNEYYGADEACLSCNELKQCMASASTIEQPRNTSYSSASLRGELPSPSRDYSISLSPSIIPSLGPLISALIQSGVARYGGFKLLESISMYSGGEFKSVPGSKEEIFKSKELSLMDKRRLMRFLTFASGDFEGSPELQGKESMPFFTFLEEVFSLGKQLASSLTYALALCKTASDPTLPALQRIKQYLRSAGRYGPSPFLVGQYGGLGELAQGFCRVCAVSGGTYILGREISVETKQGSSSEPDGTKNFKLRLSEIPDELTADVIISSAQFLPKLGIDSEAGKGDVRTVERHAYCIALVHGSIARPPTAQSTSSTDENTEEPVETKAEGTDDKDQTRPVDAALLVFLPGELPSGKASNPVNVLVNGEGTLSCPRGKTILYVSTQLPISSSTNSEGEDSPDPESLLCPYLDAVLSHFHTLSGSQLKELSSAFYVKSTPSIPPSLPASLKERKIVLAPPLPDHFAEAGDVAAVNSEAIFRDVLKCLGREDAESVDVWPALERDDEDEDMM